MFRGLGLLYSSSLNLSEKIAQSVNNEWRKYILKYLFVALVRPNLEM